MSKRVIYLVVLVLCAVKVSFAQQSLPIEVSDDKTTHLIFPSGVRYFDYGSEDVGVIGTTEPNIIKVKAAVTNFPTTNLTVMTEGGVFYSFLLNYNRSPKNLNYFFEESQGIKYSLNDEQGAGDKGSSSSTEDSNSAIDDDAEIETNLVQFDLLKNVSKDSFVAGTRNSRITLVLKDVYVDKDNLYFIMDAKNESAVNYDIEFIKFFIKPKRKRKQATIQDIEVTPINSVNVPTILARDSGGMSYFAFVLDKLTIADDKKFVVEMWEKNGERSIELEISNKVILNAKTFKK